LYNGWGSGGCVQIFVFFGQKNLKKIGSFGFFSVTLPKISKIKLEIHPKKSLKSHCGMYFGFPLSRK
jgi:hypothetical protein